MTEMKRLSKLIRQIQGMGIRLQLAPCTDAPSWLHSFNVTYHLPNGKRLVGGLYMRHPDKQYSRMWAGTGTQSGPGDVFLVDVCAKRCDWSDNCKLGRLVDHLYGMGGI